MILDAPGWAVLVAALAAGGGLALRRRLQLLSYRTEREATTSAPGPRWWVVPLLGALAWLLTVRVSQEAALSVPARAVLLLTLVLVAAGCVALAAIDLDVHRLPDRLVAGCAGVLVAGLGVVALLGAGVEPWSRSVLCALASGALYLLLALLSLARGSWGVGLGDVKLSMLLGAALGWFGALNAVIGIYAGFLVGGAVALGLLLTRRVSVGDHLAYGPAMMLGALVGVMLPADIVPPLF